MSTRSLSSRLLPLGALALALSLGAVAPPATAGAAVRHAAPNGSGSACTDAARCTLAQAIAGAGAADEVRVHAGTHHLPTGAGGLDDRLTILGAPGEAMPTVETQPPLNGQCGLAVGNRSTVRRLRLRPIATGSRAICTLGQATLDQLVITGTHADLVGLHLERGEWTRVDAVSINLPTSGSRAIVVRDSAQVQLDNVSARGGGAALWVRGEHRATSVAARSSLFDGSATPIQISCFRVTAFTIVTVTSSALGAVDEGECAFTGSATNLGLAGVDVTADALGALRPGPDSTLLNAGRIVSGETNDRDVDGDPRSLGIRSDIGADEYRYAPFAAVTGATEVAADGATLAAVTLGNGAEHLRARFELGPTPAFGRTIAAPIDLPSGRGLAFPAARARVDGLAPATTYHVRVVVSNEWGQEVAGPAATFTTAPVPTGGEPGPGDGAGGSGGGDDPGAGAPGGAAPAQPAAPSDPPVASPPVATPPAAIAAPNASPACRVRVVKARRRGRAILRGRCSARATLTVAVARRGRRPLVRRVVVPGRRRFAQPIRLGRLATLRRALTVTAGDGAGTAARPRSLRIVRR